MADPKEYQRKEVVIPDEQALVRQLLTDDYRNHLLKFVVPYENIITAYQGTWEEFPAIYIKKVGNTTMITEAAIPGGIGSSWKSLIQLDLITSDDSFCNYPPPAPGEADTEDTRYDGAEKVLNVIHQIIHRILSENRQGYESLTLPTFQWDNVQPVGFENIDGGYDGVRDIWALSLIYEFDFEVVSRTDG